MANYKLNYTGAQIDDALAKANGAVRFDVPQTNSDAQKAVAQKNIGLDSVQAEIYSHKAEYTFEQGSISGNDGSLVNATNTIRTLVTNENNEIKKFSISCSAGYTYAIRYYNSSDVMFDSVSFTSDAKDYIVPDGTAKIGFCLRYTSDITPVVSDNITILVSIAIAVEELTAPNIKAEYTFEQGSISGTDGSLVNDTRTIRTLVANENGKIKKFAISCSAGYTYAIRYYNSSDVMIGAVTFTSTAKEYIIPAGTAKIGFCLRYTSDITPSASDNIFIYIAIRSEVIDLRETVDDLAKDVDALGKITVSASLSAKLATAIEYNRTQKFVNIGFFTDTHSNDNDATFAINTMNAIMATKMMNACIHGGDLITTYDLSYSQYVEEMCKNMTYYKNHGEMYFVKGNHDNNHATVLGDNATKYQYHMMMQNNYSNAIFNENDPCACYFYINCQHEKVRIIVLDSFTVEGYSATIQFDTEQLSWLYNTALDVEDGWTVIVFSHQFVDSLTKACNIFNAFAHRGTTYGDYVFDNNITTHFVGVIHGHEHTDTFSNKAGFNIIGVAKAYGADGAVDILTIDTTENKMYETRIGGGENRVFSFS